MKKEYVIVPILWLATSAAFGWLLAHFVKPPGWDYYAFDVKVVLAMAGAQLIRSFRDAIDHNKGSRPLGQVWHYLVWPEAGCWMFAGLMSPYAFPYIVKSYILAVAGGLILGWAVHKIGLHFFRKLPFTEDWW